MLDNCSVKEDHLPFHIYGTHHATLQANKTSFLMKLYRDQGSACVNQSLRILTNILAAGAFHSNASLDDVICSLIGFAGVTVSMSSFDGNALIVKVWSVPWPN